jgi:thiamine pyrophosphate-dependent acetolactate synthase large subunit-like protein
MLEISVNKIAQVVLMSRELDRAEGELRAFIDRLTDEEQVSLVALMWIGRGAFEPEELEEAIRTAAEEATTPTADYLLGTPHLSDHLENGLDALGLSAMDEEDDLIRGG